MNELAAYGGDPVSAERIPYHRPSLSEREIDRAAEVIRSGFVVGPGPYSTKVEEHLETAWGVPRVLTTTSCTHALEMAFLAMDLQPEDEIIVPSFTYVSSALAVIRTGGTPVFADVHPETWMLTPRTVDEALSTRTRGVLMVHYGGFPGPVDEIVEYCHDHGLECVEDAAQGFDTGMQGQRTGCFGRFGAISFHGTKSLTCGEGGLLIINREEDVDRCEMIRDKGTDRSRTRLGDVDRYTWRSIGSSYVLSDILAAVLWEQLRRWPRIKEQRLALQKRLREALNSLDDEGYFRLITPPEGATENGHLTAFQFPWPEHRDWFLTLLQAEGIQAREHYRPLHRSPFARQHLRVDRDFPGTLTAANSVVRIPCYPDLSENQFERIVLALQKVYGYLPPPPQPPPID